MASQKAELKSELPVAIMPYGSTSAGAWISRTTSARRPSVEAGFSVMAMTVAPRLRAMPARKQTSDVSPPLERPDPDVLRAQGPGRAVLAVAGMQEEGGRPAAGEQVGEAQRHGVRSARPGDDDVTSTVEQQSHGSRQHGGQLPGQPGDRRALGPDHASGEIQDGAIIHRTVPGACRPSPSR